MLSTSAIIVLYVRHDMLPQAATLLQTRIMVWRGRSSSPSRRGTLYWEVTRSPERRKIASSSSWRTSPGDSSVGLSVAAVRSNLVVVIAKVKRYEDPMTVLIDSGESYNFATKATVKKS